MPFVIGFSKHHNKKKETTHGSLVIDRNNIILTFAGDVNDLSVYRRRREFGDYELSRKTSGSFLSVLKKDTDDNKELHSLQAHMSFIDNTTVHQHWTFKKNVDENLMKRMFGTYIPKDNWLSIMSKKSYLHMKNAVSEYFKDLTNNKEHQAIEKEYVAEKDKKISDLKEIQSKQIAKEKVAKESNVVEENDKKTVFENTNDLISIMIMSTTGTSLFSTGDPSIILHAITQNLAAVLNGFPEGFNNEIIFAVDNTSDNEDHKSIPQPSARLNRNSSYHSQSIFSSQSRTNALQQIESIDHEIRNIAKNERRDQLITPRSGFFFHHENEESADVKRKRATDKVALVMALADQEEKTLSKQGFQKRKNR